MKKTVKKIILAVSIAVLLFGLAVFLYPSFKTATQNVEAKKAVNDYQEYLLEVQATESGANEETRIFQSLWEACEEYNRQLPMSQYVWISTESVRRAAIDLKAYGWERDDFAYLSIPDAGLEVPVYLGANAENLNIGAAHLGTTSLPIGGESTHCVLAGHRSWNGALMFRNLANLEIGDFVYVTNPWETLTYRVIDSQIISPDDFQQILIQDGKDLLSIFTCTYPNSHRLIVTCERVLDE